MALVLQLIYCLQYTAAAKQSALDNTSRAVSSLFSVLKQDTKLQRILSTPTLQDADKQSIISELEKHTGGADKSGTVKNFLSTLAQNNRLGILEGVCDKFTQLISAGKGEIELVITSAAVRLTRSHFRWSYPEPERFSLSACICGTYYLDLRTDHLRNSTTSSSNVSSPQSPSRSTHRARSSKL